MAITILIQNVFTNEEKKVIQLYKKDRLLHLIKVITINKKVTF